MVRSVTAEPKLISWQVPHLCRPTNPDDAEDPDLAVGLVVGTRMGAGKADRFHVVHLAPTPTGTDEDEVKNTSYICIYCTSSHVL